MTNGKNITELFADLIEHLSTLFRKEIELAKVEAGEKMQQATRATVYLMAGGAVLLAGFIVLLDAAVAWIVHLGLELRWSTLIVGAVVVIIGYVMFQKGVSDLKTKNLTPRRTVEQVRRDAHIAREQVR